jgi:CRISPR system Cascade subunit CasC
MFVELHILQNFAPSNLNRDDTGSPKDCEFGGYRRARISSQCLKRAIRTCFREQRLLPETALASRTKRLADALVERLEARGKPAAEARAVVEVALRGANLKLEKGLTQYLLFLAQAEIDALAALCIDYWGDLAKVAAEDGAARDAPDGSAAPRSAREAKRSARATVPEPVQRALDGILDGGRAADLALFGRMIADLPDRNVDAACQVAHAISTNKVSMEFDFYTAVDDLKPDDTSGAGMLGTVEFNSACFYRYANVDLAQLIANLGGDEELARRTLEAFVRASVAAVPTGKQNSMAAHNPPSLVFAVARDRNLWSLANAFCKPVRPDSEEDLVERSIRVLDAYWGRLTRMYGERGIAGKWVCALEGTLLEELAPCAVGSVDDLVERLLATASFVRPGEG